MTNLDQASEPAAGLAVAQRWLPALLLLFSGSGCAALIYEVVWFQLLQLSIGSSAVSLGVLLGIFMGGMCLGSLLLPRYINPTHHPLRVYAFLELGIGLFGIVVLFGVPVIADLYTRIAGTGQVSLCLRAVLAVGVLGRVLAGACRPRGFDVWAATFVAVAVNVVVAGLALMIAGRTGGSVAVVEPAAGSTLAAAPGSRLVYLSSALSGLAAL